MADFNLPFSDRRKMAEIGPGVVLQYIEAITYPATQQEIINTAITHDALDEVVSLLKKLPTREYKDGNDVGVGKWKVWNN